jgi:hypothetical protein
MSQCDQARNAFLQKINYVTWILDEDFECLGKEMFIYVLVCKTSMPSPKLAFKLNHRIDVFFKNTLTPKVP